MRGRAWTPLGFVLVMLGFGLALDSPSVAIGWAVVVVGGVALMHGFGLLRRAFVPRATGR
jgi:hypothetical protein